MKNEPFRPLAALIPDEAVAFETAGRPAALARREGQAVPCLFRQAGDPGGASLKSIKAAAGGIRAIILVTSIRQDGGTFTAKAHRLRLQKDAAGAIGDVSQEQR